MRLISACFTIVLFVSLANAQTSKPWTEWTKKDVDKALSDSAWSQTQSEGGGRAQSQESQSAITQVAAPRAADRELNTTAQSGETKSAPSVKYHVRFLSAKPVRAAFARLVMLKQAQPNDQLATQLQGFIDRSFADYIVISVGVEVSDERMGGMLTQAFSKATTETLKENVYLERKDGKKLFLMEYRAPTEDGMGAKFVFERRVDGQPFLGENDSVRFFAQFNERMKLNTKYKLSEMLYDGKLEY